MKESEIPESPISLYKLHVLCSIVENGGVTRAAEHLHVSQPVVSAHLRDLQARLGVRLFEQRGRSLQLTAAGVIAHEWARDTLSRAREMARLLSGLAEGAVGSAAVAGSMSIGSYVVPRLLTEFRAVHPDASLSLQIGDPEQVLSSVELGGCDAAVVVHDGPPDGGVVAERLGSDELVLVAGSDSGFPARVSAADLVRLPLVSAPRGTARQRIVDREMARLGLTARNVVIELGHPEPLKRAARAGLGLLLINRYAVGDELAAGTLREVAVSGVRFEVPVYLVYRGKRTFSPLQVMLMDFLRRRIPPELYSPA
jgi:LysR family transcriptional regulator, low CO2-responsive transcriptional regulator